MRIRMLTCYAGADFVVNAGEETERFSDAEAIRMIENGTAVPVAKAIEKAVKAPPETRGPLDHDGKDGPGGSVKGYHSTAAKGARKRKKRAK